MTGSGTRIGAIESRWLGPVVTALTLLAIVLARPISPISSPSVILLLTVAVAAVLGGVTPALLSAGITVVFVLVDASQPGQLFSYTSDSLSRVVISVVTAPTMALLVGSIQARLRNQQESDAARMSDERQRALTETATDAIITVDASSTIQATNPAAELLFGYPPGGLLGRRLTELMPPSLRERHRAGIRRYAKTGERHIPWTGVELTGRHSSGREFPVEVSFGEYGSGEERRFTGIVRDISIRKELESRLLQAQKMEAIGQLAGGVAHDFNNMLTAISGYAELLRMDMPTHDPRLSAIDGISQAASRAAALTRQLLAFSRRQQLKPSTIELNDVVARVEPLLHRLLGEDIRIVRHLETSSWPVLADPAQIETVLINLAVNSRDAMPNGGTLTIETANVELDATYAGRHVAVEPGEYSMLAVSDTGIGMDAETLAHVFEPFYTTKPVGEGTGLGLATVYGTVNQSGGHIWPYSEPGKGTTFKIYLPRALGAPSPTAAPRTSTHDSNGTETILVAEDEETVRGLIMKVLERQGYRVLMAQNAAEAIDVIRRRSAELDLLLTDVVMPDRSGLALADEARSVMPGLRILYMSGYTARALAPRGLDGRPRLLEKPFTPQRLAQAVREALDGSGDDGGDVAGHAYIDWPAS